MGKDDKVILSFDDKTLEDRFIIHHLLKAANISLEQMCKFSLGKFLENSIINYFFCNFHNFLADSVGYDNMTMRDSGLVLYVTLHYTNLPETSFPVYGNMI